MVYIHKKEGTIAEKIEEELRRLQKKKNKKKEDSVSKESSELDSEGKRDHSNEKIIAEIVAKLAKKKGSKLEEEVGEIKESDIFRMLSTMIEYLDKIDDKEGFIANLYGITNARQRTVSLYGAPPPEASVDYGKIWGHLGQDTFVRMYEGHLEAETSSIGKTTQEMVSYKNFENSVKHFKYFMPGGQSSITLNPFSGSTPWGADSKEWEKMKLYMMVDGGVMFNLLMKTGV